jgi:hypothetical protein
VRTGDTFLSCLSMGYPKLSLRGEDIAADGEKDLEYNDRVPYEVIQVTVGWR